jgi:hypothetical protein
MPRYVTPKRGPLLAASFFEKIVLGGAGGIATAWWWSGLRYGRNLPFSPWLDRQFQLLGLDLTLRVSGGRNTRATPA